MGNVSASEIDVDAIMAEIRGEVEKRKQAIQQHQSQLAISISPSSSSSEISLSPVVPLAPLGYLHGTAAYAERMLANATTRSRLRENLPGEFHRFPLVLFKPLERLILKIFNVLFKDQREVSSNLIQAIRELLKIERALLAQSDQTAALSESTKVLQDQTRGLQQQTENFQYQAGDLQYQTENLQYQAGNLQHQTESLQHQTDSLQSQTDSLQSQTDSLQSQNGGLQSQVESLTSQIQDLQSQLEGLKTQLFNQSSSGREELTNFGQTLGQTNERLVSVDGRLQRLEQNDINGLLQEQKQRWEQFYLDFENTFRGDRASIKERLATAYEEIIQLLRETSQAPGVNHRVLDIGSGRGEWLEYLKEIGISAYGVDINPAMAEDCKNLGLEVVEADGLKHLASLEDQSLSLVSAFHVAEHLPIHRLLELANEVQRVLKPNGVAIFETPNPENLSVGACNFYLDPTHRNPLPPPLLQFVFQQAGFERVEILRLHPMAANDHAVYHPYLQTMFFGHQDYAILAWKSTAEGAGAPGAEA